MARAICAEKKAQGIRCARLTEMGLHEPGFKLDINPFRDHKKFDVLIMEHLDTPGPSQMQSKDVVIRLEGPR